MSRKRSVKVYLASRYSRRLELVDHAQELTELGYTVTSRWLAGTHDAEHPTPEQRADWAAEDWADLMASDWVISFTEQPKALLANPGRGGRHVEFGAAMATHKRLIVVGLAETVFHCLPSVERFDSWLEFLECVAWRERAP